MAPGGHPRHIGLTPQSASQLGGYKAQGRDAEALEEAGAFAILQCIPARVKIPVYGLGGGKDVDGQLMIVHDMIGMFERFTPKFVFVCAGPGI